MSPVNRRRVVITSWLATIVLVLCSGCSSHRGGLSARVPPGEIPLGIWSGEGVFVYENWKAEAGERASIYRHYPTTLSIRSSELDGRKAIEMEIRSERGLVPQLDGNSTHLKTTLVKAKRVSDTTVLYRLVAFHVNPPAAPRPSLDNDAASVRATCITRDSVTVLQICYMDNFVDTFRFEGDRLEKTGVVFNLKEGLIHWAERLFTSD